MSAVRSRITTKSVVGRALAVLTCFDLADTDLRLSEIAARTGLPKPTVHRLVLELTAFRMLEQTAGGVRLGAGLLELAELEPRRRRLRDAAGPMLAELRAITGETVHLAVLDGSDVVYLDKLPGRGTARLPSRVGGRMPAYCTAVGKALLASVARPTVEKALRRMPMRRLGPNTIVSTDDLRAELYEIRRRGVAFDQEESGRGTLCVAAAVHSGSGGAVAAISISSGVDRLDRVRVEPLLVGAAGYVATSLKATAN